MRRRLVSLVALGAFAVFLYLAYLANEIRQQAATDQAQPADIIVVLGAAEYRGKPSPVLEARLRHALHLYEKKLAPYVLTTGGAGGDPRFTESEVGRNFLVSHGVPPEAVVMENEGESTAHSTVVAAEIMSRMRLGSCLVVSDGYHLYRVKRMLEERGMRVFASPRPEKERTQAELWRLCFREAIGVMAWQIGLHL